MNFKKVLMVFISAFLLVSGMGPVGLESTLYAAQQATVTFTAKDNYGNVVFSEVKYAGYGTHTLNLDTLVIPGYMPGSSQPRTVTYTVDPNDPASLNQTIELKYMEKQTSIEIIYMTDTMIMRRDSLLCRYNNPYAIKVLEFDGYTIVPGQQSPVYITFTPTDDYLTRNRTIVFKYTPLYNWGIHVNFNDTNGTQVGSVFVEFQTTGGKTIIADDYLTAEYGLERYAIAPGKLRFAGAIISLVNPTPTVTFIVEEITVPQVTGLKADGKTSGSIALSWDAAPGATSYEVSYNGASITSDGTSVTLQNLLPDTEYAIKVRAKNAAVYGNYSAEIKTKTEKAFIDSVEYKINGLAGQEQVIGLTAADIDNFSGKVFTVKYDPSRLTLADFAAQTEVPVLSAGNVGGTDLEILSITGGEIKFKTKKTVPNGQKWSGVLTLIKFNIKASGETVIKFEQ